MVLELLRKILGKQPFLPLRKYIIPASKRVGADLLEFAMPEVAYVVSGQKKFKTAAKSVRRHTLRKQPGSGRQKKHSSQKFEAKQSVTQRHFYSYCK